MFLCSYLSYSRLFRLFSVFPFSHVFVFTLTLICFEYLISLGLHLTFGPPSYFLFHVLVLETPKQFHFHPYHFVCNLMLLFVLVFILSECFMSIFRTLLKYTLIFWSLKIIETVLNYVQLGVNCQKNIRLYPCVCSVNQHVSARHMWNLKVMLIITWFYQPVRNVCYCSGIYRVIQILQQHILLFM